MESGNQNEQCETNKRQTIKAKNAEVDLVYFFTFKLLKSSLMAMTDLRTNDVLYFQTCVQWLPLGPKIVAVVGRWSLFRDHLFNKSSKWDFKMVVVEDR